MTIRKPCQDDFGFFLAVREPSRHGRMAEYGRTGAELINRARTSRCVTSRHLSLSIVRCVPEADIKIVSTERPLFGLP